MSYVHLTCPQCGKATILDEIDGKGFCMYCGAALDGEKVKFIPMDPMAEQILGLMMSDDISLDRSDEPWYGLISEAVDLMEKDDYEAAAESFLKGIEGQDEETVSEMKGAMMMYSVKHVMTGMFEGVAYQGGIIPMARALDEGTEDTSAAAFLESILDTIMGADTPVEDGDVAYNIVSSAYILLSECFLLEPAIDVQLYLLDTFISGCNVYENAVCYEDDVSREDMVAAAGSLANAIDKGTEGMEDADFARLEKSWEDDPASIGSRASELLMSICGDSFDDSEAFWNGMDDEAEAYVAAYMAAGN